MSEGLKEFDGPRGPMGFFQFEVSDPLNGCHIRGCRSLETKCKDCGRLIADRILPTSEWIKIEDRLPDKEKNVLCFYDDIYIDVAEYWYNENGKHIFFRSGAPLIDSVTYWMELPEMPND